MTVSLTLKGSASCFPLLPYVFHFALGLACASPAFATSMPEIGTALATLSPSELTMDVTAEADQSCGAEMWLAMGEIDPAGQIIAASVTVECLTGA